jgi:SAM-dependent methyltransferase
MGLFVWPEAKTLYRAGGAYRDGYATYSHYNYLRPGPIAWMKRRRLDVALQLARPWFHRTAAIDFGCGDGILIASLSRYFPFVFGVDLDPAACLIAEAVVADLALPNVRFGRFLPDPSEQSYGIAFILETLEHIGSAHPADADGARVDTIRKLFSVLAPDARIVISVPRTTGLAFLAKYAAQRVLGYRGDVAGLSVGDALRAGLCNDTSRLADRWQGGHVGFNDRTFERALRQSVEIVGRRRTALSVCYLVASRTRAIASGP